MSGLPGHVAERREDDRSCCFCLPPGKTNKDEEATAKAALRIFLKLNQFRAAMLIFGPQALI
ncbi:hypothetical protein HMPREF0201_02791 [Cedecea davisae DSM 4568]|uniref:Uncharacterized protein n=1 Tax=Cedecea davisae DSM 4568 TaxID=566551 RepID=S3IV24_9ENTR|nr:hypothetical protein HMPREF0201_02791 [Cedecea davisae DSM 4568]